MSFPVIHFQLHQGGLPLGMYISCFFVLISFALGSQRKPSFQWNVELSSSLKQLHHYIDIAFLQLEREQRVQELGSNQRPYIRETMHSALNL